MTIHGTIGEWAVSETREGEVMVVSPTAAFEDVATVNASEDRLETFTAIVDPGLDALARSSLEDVFPDTCTMTFGLSPFPDFVPLVGSWAAAFADGAGMSFRCVSDVAENTSSFLDWDPVVEP